MAPIPFPRPAWWTRLRTWLTHRHRWTPDRTEVVDAHGERHVITVHRCAQPRGDGRPCQATRLEDHGPQRARVVAWMATGLLAGAPLVAAAAEVKRCDLPPRPVPTVVSHVAALSGGDLYPMLPDGTEVPWGTPGATFPIPLAGMSNAVQLQSGLFARFKALFGTAAGKGNQIKYFSFAKGGQATREWADPNNPVWAKAIQSLAQKGLTPAQVQIWIQVHTVVYWATRGQLTAADVAAVKANVRFYFPNVKLFLDADLTTMEWAHRQNSVGQPLSGGTSVEGIPYATGELIEHPSPQEIAHDGYVLSTIALTQDGVEAGERVEFFSIAGLPMNCAQHYQGDGVHYTGGATGGAMYVGSALADRAHAWLRDFIAWARP